MKVTDIESLLRDREVVVLDVREAGELAADGTIPGALHIPIGELEKRLGELPRGRRILTA